MNHLDEIDPISPEWWFDWCDTIINFNNHTRKVEIVRVQYARDLNNKKNWSDWGDTCLLFVTYTIDGIISTVCLDTFPFVTLDEHKRALSGRMKMLQDMWSK